MARIAWMISLATMNAVLLYPDLGRQWWMENIYWMHRRKLQYTFQFSWCIMCVLLCVVRWSFAALSQPAEKHFRTCWKHSNLYSRPKLGDVLLLPFFSFLNFALNNYCFFLSLLLFLRHHPNTRKSSKQTKEHQPAGTTSFTPLIVIMHSYTAHFNFPCFFSHDLAGTFLL